MVVDIECDDFFCDDVGFCVDVGFVVDGWLWVVGMDELVGV